MVTLPKGTLKISTLKLQPTVATTDFGSDVRIEVRTENGEDSQGYTATVRDTDIAVLESTRAVPNENGVGVFTLRTGANAGGKSGDTKVDIIGINTGARKEFTLTISATATT